MLLRHQIYAKEAADLLRTVTMYKVVREAQLMRFYDKKEDAVKNLLRYLVRQGRIVRSEDEQMYAASQDCLRAPDRSMDLALWVLADFIDRVDFHTCSDFPVKIVFFAGADMYEVIHVPYDEEILITQALRMDGKEEVKRIIIVDMPEQIQALRIPGTIGFCTVGPDGAIQYYKFQ